MENRFNKTKIVLLAIIFIFGTIFMIQNLISDESSMQVFELEEEADTIMITAADFKTTVHKKTDGYYTGTKKLIPADENKAEKMFESASKIFTLSTLTKDTSFAEEERYGLDKKNVAKIEIKNGQKLLRTIYVGKDSTAGNQSYIRIDDSRDTLLARSGLRSIFVMQENDLRTKNIYTINENERILGIEVNGEAKTFNPELISELDAEKWISDAKFHQEEASTVKILTDKRTLELYLIKGAQTNENDYPDWLCRAKDDPDCFYISWEAGESLVNPEEY